MTNGGRPEGHDMKSAVLSGAILCATAVAANAAPVANRPLGVEASIPFASTTGIRSFEAEGDRVLWIEGRRGEWYRAKLFGPCIGLDHSLKVGFVTRGGGSLDRFGQVVVDGSKCQISSLVTSAPPPKKTKNS
jgi:hypothetical protein